MKDSAMSLRVRGNLALLKSVEDFEDHPEI